MFSIHTIYRQIFKVWRKRRYRLFLDTLKPAPTDILLDVGGYPGIWAEQPQPVSRIDTLNIHEVLWSTERAPDHNINTLIGDGCALEMPDQSYDVGYSNSVIEHVGDYERQQAFASEIRRVAKSLWVQTPAFECPIEPHYMTPLVHYFPRWFQRKTVRWFTVWGWIERPNANRVNEYVDSIRLIRKSEMRDLFPDCEILTERMLWIIPKSYIAVRRDPAPSSA